MEKADLRPVGTMFDVTCPPSEFSTNQEDVTYTYQVVAHDEVHLSPNSDQTTWAERLEPIRERRRKPDYMLSGPCPHCGQRWTRGVFNSES